MSSNYCVPWQSRLLKCAVYGIITFVGNARVDCSDYCKIVDYLNWPRTQPGYKAINNQTRSCSPTVFQESNCIMLRFVAEVNIDTCNHRGAQTGLCSRPVR